MENCQAQDFLNNFIFPFIVTVLTTLLINWIRNIKIRNQKPSIYYKRIYSSADNKEWGVYKINGETIYLMPIKFEINNTSTVNKVVRDMGIYAYSNGERVGKFKQIEYRGNGINGQVDIQELYGEDMGSYSFNIPPRSIIHRNCFFALIDPTNTLKVDCLRLGYYDEQDEYIEIFLCNLDPNKVPFHGTIDSDWKKLN